MTHKFNIGDEVEYVYHMYSYLKGRIGVVIDNTNFYKRGSKKIPRYSVRWYEPFQGNMITNPLEYDCDDPKFPVIKLFRKIVQYDPNQQPDTEEDL